MTFVDTDALSARGAAARTWLQRGYLAALVGTTLAYGSASSFQTALAAFGFSLIALASLALRLRFERVQKLYGFAAALALALFAFALVQALPIGAASPFANAAWRGLDARLGGGRGFISAAPGMTLAALPALALPFLAFLSALRLFPGDDDAHLLWRALAAFGAALAVYGLVQEVAFPHALLLESKRAYLGSLTASFVSRNTAGAFFGVALIANVCFWAQGLSHRPLGAPKLYLSQRGWLGLGCTTVVAVALFLTQSRGAFAATFAALALAIALLTAPPADADQAAVWRRRRLRLGALVAVTCLFAIFGARSAYRLEEQGVGDPRWCVFASTAAAISDNWRLGAGVGAFQDVFPAYRRSECAGVFGVWERAHDVYLEGLLSFGLAFPIALGLGVAVLAVTLARGLRLRRRLRFLPIGGIAALCLAALESVVDFSLQIPGFNVYFAAVLAAAATASLGR